jgi:integrase
VSRLRQAAEDYLTMRRALGYKLRQEGRMLASFVRYVEDHAAGTGECRVTITTALVWAVQPANANPMWWAKRLTVVRCFAKHLKTIQPDTEIPPPDLLPNKGSRPTPHLFSPADIAALMGAAGRLAHPLRAATFQALVGLMASTGLRTGEAMRLDRDDINLAEGVLTVRDTKFGKSRLVPLHPSATTALTGYARRRDQLCPRPAAPSFLLSGAGTRLNHPNTSTTFAELVYDAGITWPPGQRRPHPYDLRHSFTVATLMAWHAAGVDAQSRLPALSTYLGHIEPASTYWYMQAAPELMQIVALRLETSLGDL